MHIFSKRRKPLFTLTVNLHWEALHDYYMKIKQENRYEILLIYEREVKWIQI